ncbi:MAG: phosphoglycerate dehydrogenase [Planctomycetota bacterium]|nr:phosphoglycerate dehydrogenase [Planctomycetota bacterium]
MTDVRILVADDLGAEGMEILGQAGEVTLKTGMDEDTLRETLPGYHAVIVRSATKVTARSLELAKDLVVIGRAGIGIDNIDVAAATGHGIVVMNTPLTAAVTTAEHAIALMTSLARNIPQADAALKAGRWDKKKFVGTELSGKTLGVIGLGKIGSVVASRGVGLAMNVIASDPQVDESMAPAGVQIVHFEDLLAQADFITLHVPKMEATTGLINAEAFAKMKDGVRLIHAARGGIVVEKDLLDALASGKVAGAALDVFESEPLAEDHPLRGLDNVVLTPHIGASTTEAKRNVSIDMANQIVTCLTTGIVLNGINTPLIAPADAPRVAPFLSLTRNLAGLLTQVFPGTLHSLRLTLQGDTTHAATEALKAEMIAGALAPKSDIPVTSVNAAHIAEQMGVDVFCDESSVKRDFVSLVRVEAVIDGEHHRISGTVLGHRHGRMVEFDGYLLDAIPEGHLLVTFHRDRPGVIGDIGRVLGTEGTNVARVQMGAPENGSQGPSLGIWNLDNALVEGELQQICEIDSIEHAYSVQL